MLFFDCRGMLVKCVSDRIFVTAWVYKKETSSSRMKALFMKRTGSLYPLSLSRFHRFWKVMLKSFQTFQVYALQSKSCITFIYARVNYSIKYSYQLICSTSASGFKVLGRLFPDIRAIRIG